MTPEREKDIQQTAIRVLSGFGVDFNKPYQSISFIGMSEFRRDVSKKEWVEALRAMKGVELDFEKYEFRVPTTYFK